MSVRIINVDASTRQEFVDYALVHGREHDESFVEPEDLAEFDPTQEPAALAVDEDGAPSGAASLLVAGYADGGAARFRILHAQDAGAYAELVRNVIARIPARVERCFVFIPDDPGLADVLAGIGFTETRRAHVLRRQGPPPPAPCPPDGVHVAVASPESDAAGWATVVNAAFSGFPGRYDMAPELAAQLLTRERVLEGGALIARRGRTPAGVALVAREPDEGGVRVAAVDTLAIAPSEQGIGLGRAMLRAVVRIALAAGYDVVDLSTNELNERALALYRSEGFDFIDVRVCWTLDRAGQA